MIVVGRMISRLVYKVYICPLINGNKIILKKEIEFNSIPFYCVLCANSVLCTDSVLCKDSVLCTDSVFFSGLKLMHALINRFITLYELIFISFDHYEHQLVILSRK